MSKTITGSWSPDEGILPIVQNYEVGYFIVTETGIFNGVSYDKGDWLIYIENSESQWFKSKGGVTVLDTSSSLNKPDPGWYSRVYLDNNGNIINADIHVLEEDLPNHKHNIEDTAGLEDYIKTVIGTWLKQCNASMNGDHCNVEYDSKTKSIKIIPNIDETSIGFNDFSQLQVVGGNGSGGVDDGYNGGSCANHEHTADQIKGLTDFISTVIKESGLLQIDVNNIPIDETTIIINKNGQLSAVSAAIQKHKHVIADITDLDPELLVWACFQQIIAKDSTVDLDTGKFILSTLRLDQALAAFNNAFLSIETRLKIIEEKLANTEPPLPNKLEKISITSSKYAVIDLNTKTPQSGTFSAKIVTSHFYADKTSTLTLFINEKPHESFTLVNPVLGYTQGNLSITGEMDSYLGHPVYGGKFKSVQVTIDIPNLPEGLYSIYLVQSFQKVDFTSNTLSNVCFIEEGYDPVVTGTLKPEFKNNTYVSGVPSMNGMHEPTYNFTIESNKRFVPKDFFYIKENGRLIDLPTYSIVGRNILISDITSALDGFSGTFEAYGTAKDYNGKPLRDYVHNIPNINYDTTWIESAFRVQCITTQNVDEVADVTGFSEFDKVAYLSNYEAQIINNMAIIPSKDYSNIGGPNYSKYMTDFTDKDTTWVTLRFPCFRQNNVAINLIQANGKSFPLKKDGTLEGVKLYVAQSSNPLAVQNWVNGNTPYDGRSGASGYNFPGLDLFKSTNETRVVTWGQKAIVSSGYLFVKIGVQTSVDLEEVVASLFDIIRD